VQAGDWHHHLTTNQLPHLLLCGLLDWLAYHVDHHRDQLSIMRLCSQYIDDDTMSGIYLWGSMRYGPGIERDYNNHWDCLSHMRLCSIHDDDDDDDYKSMHNLHLRWVFDRVPCDSHSQRDELPKLHLRSKHDN
jgi:hypothetical protein